MVLGSADAAITEKDSSRRETVCILEWQQSSSSVVVSHAAGHLWAPGIVLLPDCESLHNPLQDLEKIN